MTGFWFIYSSINGSLSHNGSMSQDETQLMADRSSFRNDSVIWWPFLRFAGLSLTALFNSRDSSGAPLPALVLRVGVVGHVELRERDAIEPTLDGILSSLQSALRGTLQDYKNAFGGIPKSPEPEIECRLISQLAAGADQCVAGRAVRLGYKLQCPLPIDIDIYAEDVRRHPGVDKDPVGELRHLAAKATVLELDGEVDSSTGGLTNGTYENSAFTMLGHSDLLIAVVRTDAGRRSGGTRWLMDEAERRGMPVVEILVDQPESSGLVLGEAWNRQKVLFQSGAWATDLVRSIVLPKSEVRRYRPSGWFEEGFRARIRADGKEWLPNRSPATESCDAQISSWFDNIHRDYLPFWLWAEHRANTYSDLYRGAYVAVSLLGLLAVIGALLGAMNDAWTPTGKIVELGAIVLLLLLWTRAHSYNWRQRWLGYRLLEQRISNAAALSIVGATIPTVNSPALVEFQKQGAWIDWYLRAVIRQASLPAAKLDTNNLRRAGKFVLSAQIDHQIRYYESAIVKNHDANERLEAIAVWSLWGTMITAVAYLFVHLYAEEHLHWPIVWFHQAALTGGIFLPALVATLAAIRAQGEFLQLETRYRGMLAHLKDLRQRFERVLRSAEDQPFPLLSACIGRYTEEAATAMLDEVNQWRSLLYTHEMER